MEWYIPITIIPAIGLLTLSTVNLLVSLNNEIRELNKEKEKYISIIQLKLGQLKELNYALIAQYLAAFLFVIGGISGQISKSDMIVVYLVLLGVVFLTISIGLLIYYALKSVAIRQKHLKL